VAIRIPPPGDTPRRATIKFETKREAKARELKKKVRIAIRGDLIKPGAEYNPDKTSSQTPSHTALRIFLAVDAAGSLPIEFLMFQEPTHEQTQTRHAEKPCGSSRALTVASNTRYVSLSCRKRLPAPRTPAKYENNIVKRTLSNLGEPYWRTSHLRSTLTRDHTGLVYCATLTTYHCRLALSSTLTRSANNWNELGTTPDSPYSQVPASNI
jgi:hypothetical protein